MSKQFGFEYTSRLNVSEAELWQHASSMAGVNAELMPFARMSFPKQVATFNPKTIVLGQTIFHSWILLFGFLPVDYHALCFEEMDNQHFLERSTSLIFRLWEHERKIEAGAGGTVIRDRVSYQTRLPFLGYLLYPIYRLIFQARHRQLRQLFKQEVTSKI